MKDAVRRENIAVINKNGLRLNQSTQLLKFLTL